MVGEGPEPTLRAEMMKGCIVIWLVVVGRITDADASWMHWPSLGVVFEEG